VNGVKTFLKLGICCFAVFTGGCFSSNPADLAAFKKPYQVEVTAPNYMIQPPDEIMVICPSVPEINQQQQRVRPDGKVSFPNIGEVDVAGKTPTQVSNVLREKVSKLYALSGDYPVDVRVAVFKSSFYYVLGEVSFPGAKPYTGRDTALTALADANPTILSWGDRIQVIHPSVDPNNIKPKIFELHWDKMVAHGDTSKDVLLSEGDIIYVPPTILAAIAMKLEEFLRPIGRAFSTAYLVQGERTNY
jgi:polysaccharide export outer membrane protein